ncbi:MAG: redoxin domain-containing protein [Anaerolineales bacterium]|nr:redoxin domain-containing protein [Anaerolineales bacterium]
MNWLLTDRRRWWTFSLVVLLLGIAWAWQSRAPAAAGVGQLPSPRAGFPAPDFTLAALDGSATTLTDLRGQVVIVNVWASWCGPCRAEMPALEAVYIANRHRGLVVLAVNSTVQDTVPDAQSFAASLSLTLPILLDPAGEVTRGYLVRGLPSTFFIDRQGIIRSVVFGGPLSRATLQATLDPLLEAAP